MIKFDHTHVENGKKRDCFLIKCAYGHFSEIHILILISRANFTGTRVALAYNPATGCWYMYNIQTGEEMATIRDEMLAEHFKSLSIGTLNIDSQC